MRLKNAFSTVRRTAKTGQGYAGFDNPRENIDPHVKTKVLDTIEAIFQRIKLLGTTTGSVLFVGANNTITEDNSNFYYDQTNKRLGLGTNNLNYPLTVKVNTAGENYGLVLVSNGEITNSRPGIIQYGLRTAGGIAYDINSAFLGTTIGNAVRATTMGVWGSASTSSSVNYTYLDSRSTGAYNNATIKIDVNNRLGVGLTTTLRPKSTLDVRGGISAGSYAGVYSASANGFVISGTMGVGTHSPDDQLQVVGNAKIGEDTTNYAEFDTDGTLMFHGTATMFDDQQVNLGEVAGSGWFSTPGVDIVEYRSGSALEFKNSTTDSYKARFNVQLSHKYKEGSDIEFHIHIGNNSATSGDAVFKLTYEWASAEGTFPAATSTSQTVTIDGTNGKHQMEDIIASISGSGQKISSILLCTLERVADDGDDDFSESVYVVGLDFHIEVNSVGSDSELVK